VHDVRVSYDGWIGDMGIWDKLAREICVIITCCDTRF
jgi:hypothetical protein